MTPTYLDLQTPPRLVKRRRAMRAVARGLVLGHYRQAVAVAPADPSAALTRSGGDDEGWPDEAAPGERGRRPRPSCAGPAPGPRPGSDPARPADPTPAPYGPEQGEQDMATSGSTHIHPKGDAVARVQPYPHGGAEEPVLGCVRLGDYTIQSTDPEELQQVADELASAAAQMRRLGVGRAAVEAEGVPA